MRLSLEYKLLSWDPYAIKLGFHYNWIMGLHKATSKQVLNQQWNLAIESDT